MVPSRTLTRYALVLTSFYLTTAHAAYAQPNELAGRVQALFRQHCFSCHGENPAKLKGDLDILNHQHLTDPERKIVIARNADGSGLIKQVESGEMPPGQRTKLSAAEKQLLRDWVAAGAPSFSTPAVADAKPVSLTKPVTQEVKPVIPVEPKPITTLKPALREEPKPTTPAVAPTQPVIDNRSTAAQVKAIFQASCFECHGGKKTSAGINILDRGLLVSKNKVNLQNPSESTILRLINARDDSVMPPAERPRLSPEQVAIIRQWIFSGAPAFPEDTASNPTAELLKRPLGVDYVLRSILDDVRKIPVQDRKYVRYFSHTHLISGGTTREELALHRDAFTKVINHLSWKPRLVKPAVIEPTQTVFRIDIRELGWDRPLYRRNHDGKYDAAYNLYDLALLEYPYGAIYPTVDAYQRLMPEYLSYANQVRPIAFVRTDWFASVVSQPPLYHDFLGLPTTLHELEKMLGVDAEANVLVSRAIRGGVVSSGVSRNNRVVERHPTQYGAYWKSYDFKSSQGTDNMLLDPIYLKASGGEMIFTLPNGLQAYFITDANGKRIDSAPTNIVVDTFASDKIVRNGMACMRCHDQGMKTFTDVVRPTIMGLGERQGFDKARALKLYPGQEVMDRHLQADTKRFQDAMAKIMERPTAPEPLRHVSRRFLDEPVNLPAASAEVWLLNEAKLRESFRSPTFVQVGLAALSSGERVPRDAWEAYYDRVVKLMKIGAPLANLDALSRPDYSPSAIPPFELEVRTNKRGNTFEAKDELVIFVKANRDVYIEVIGTSGKGRSTILVPSTTLVKAGQEYRYPSNGKKIVVPGAIGQEFITVIASTQPFRPAEVLTGKYLPDRVVHPVRINASQGRYDIEISPDPAYTVKKTLTIETR
jgi:serine/threonine-protein kinase